MMEVHRSEWDCEWDLITNDLQLIRYSYDLISYSYDENGIQEDDLSEIDQSFFLTDKKLFDHCCHWIKQGKGIEEHFTFVKYFIETYPSAPNKNHIEKAVVLLQFKKSSKILNNLKETMSDDIDLKTYARFLAIRNELANKHELNLLNIKTHA